MRGTRKPRNGRRGYAGAETKSHSAGAIPVEAAALALFVLFLAK
jgi:hypothetical protein